MPGPNVPESQKDDVYRAQQAEITRKRLQEASDAQQKVSKANREALEKAKRGNNKGGR
jgi:altronate dehydratase